MEINNKKLNFLIKLSPYLILAIILVWPVLFKTVLGAESVTLNTPSPNCLGSKVQINLSWTSTISGTPTYFVLRKIQGEPTFTEIGSTQNTFYLDADSALVSDKTYIYQIQAQRGSDFFNSNEATAVPAYCQAVLSPPAPSCQADGPHIGLTWSSVSGNLSTYEIWRDGAKIASILNTNYDDGPNIEGTKTYQYFIKTIWQDTTSKDSDTASIDALACPPVLSASAGCSDDVAPGGPKTELSWNNLLGVQNYQIYRKAQSEASFSLLVTLPSNQTSYTDYLVNSLPNSYYQSGDVSYYVKAVWLTDQKDSNTQTKAISRCKPFLTVESNCDEFSMRLSWTATKDATHYNMYRDGQYFEPQKIGVTNTSHTDYLSLCDGKKICSYTYKVEAAVLGQPNMPSNEVPKTIDCETPTPPSPPPNLDPASAYCVSGDSRISLSWTASNNVSYYTLYRENLTLGGVTPITLIETSYEDSGVESPYQYSYYVTAFGPNGTFTNSENSQTITAVNCSTPSISSLSLSRNCETGKPTITLSWTQTTNTESYEVWRGPSSSNLSLLITFDKTAPEFNSRTWKDTGVSPSTLYYYKIVSKGPPGVPSSQSNIPNITTYSCLPTTPTVTVTPACSGNNSVVNLSWTTDTANTTRYEIFRQDYSQALPIKIIYNPAIKNWQDTAVLPQTSYTYKVEAVGYTDSQRSTQGWKPAVTTNNCTAPGPFTLSEPNLYCQGSYPRADLSWSASTNATSYDVLRNAATIANTNVTSYSDFGFGNALSFDGMNDYVNAGTSGTLFSGTFTAVAWFNAKAYTNGYDRILQQGTGGSGGAGGFGIEFDAGSPQGCGGTDQVFGVIWNINTPTRVCPSSVTSLNTWHQVVLVYNGTTDQATLYVDGIPGENASSAMTSPSQMSFNIGRNPAGTNYFNGLIDEVRIYSRALSATEIQQHYQGVYSNESNLVGLWHFDEGSGTSASDSSNYGNNGTLVNGPVWVQNGLQWQNQYSWQAKAIGPGGSTLSNTTAPAQTPLCPPTKPGLTLSSFCNSGVVNTTLRWSYTTNTNQYEIYRDDVLIKTIDKNLDPALFNSRIWTDTAGLAEQKKYIYYIKAIGNAGETQSDSISVTTPSCLAPTQPQNLTLTPACGGTGNSYPRVIISWADSQNTTSYTVFRNTTTQVGVPITDNDSPTYSVTDTGVQVNTTYLYHVTANGPGGSTVSEQKPVTTTYCTPSIPSITSLTTACESNAPVNTISWSDATPFNTFEYKIYRNTTNTLPGTPTKIIASTTLPEFSTRTWKDNTDLLGKTLYYYWVKAWGPAGESSPSTVSSKETYFCQPLPAPILSLTNACTSGNNPITLLNWNKTSETTSYQLYKNASPFDSFSPSSSGYIKDWLMIGSFSYSYPSDAANAFNRDYIDGTELTVKPRAGETADGKTWIYHKSSSDYINFDSIFSPRTYVIAYAFAYIYSPIQQTVQLRIGSDDGVKAFLNGQLIHSNYIWRGASPDQDIVTVTLLSGINTLFIKVQEGAGNWGFYARFTNASAIDILTDMTNWDSSAMTGSSANYYVTAAGPGGTSPQSNPVASSPLNCLPAKPDLTVTKKCELENPQLLLDWSDDPQTQSWDVYKRRVGVGGFSFLTKIYPPQSSYTDVNVESNVQYEYYVNAVGVGTTIPSDAIPEFAPLCYEAPTKPTITATPACFGYSSRIIIDWDEDPEEKTISYNVWRKNITAGEPDFSQIYSGLAATQTQYTDIVEIGNTYQYKVEATGAGEGNSVFSDASPQNDALDCFNLPPNPPVLSLNFVISTGDLIAVSLNWTDAGSEESYKVFRREPGGSWSEIGELPANEDPTQTINYVDYTAFDNKTYEYQIYAYNKNGEAFSNVISVFVPIAKPGNFTLSWQTVGDDIKLTWTAAKTTTAGGPVTYKVLRDNFTDFSTTVIGDNISSPRECLDTDPTILELYYKAVATNNGGSTDSNIVRVNVPKAFWKEIFPW